MPPDMIVLYADEADDNDANAFLSNSMTTYIRGTNARKAQRLLSEVEDHISHPEDIAFVWD